MTAEPAMVRTELVEILRKWQALEIASIESTSQILKTTKNPLVRCVMEIILSDSKAHHIVEQALIDSLEKQAFSLTPEELGDIWQSVETHAELEKKTIELAEKALADCRLLAQRNLLSYLIEDEKKHERLLAQLEDFKRNLYPYA